MKAISIRQPWAWLILNAGKDIENRTWATSVQGRVLIHASKGMALAEYDDAKEFAYCVNEAISIPPIPKLECGGIVGSVEIVACVTESNSPWFGGPYGFVLRDPKPLPFFPCKGALWFFEVKEVS